MHAKMAIVIACILPALTCAAPSPWLKLAADGVNNPVAGVKRVDCKPVDPKVPKLDTTACNSGFAGCTGDDLCLKQGTFAANSCSITYTTDGAQSVVGSQLQADIALGISTIAATCASGQGTVHGHDGLAIVYGTNLGSVPT